MWNASVLEFAVLSAHFFRYQIMKKIENIERKYRRF
jgi:hypothetical protein